MNNATNAVHHQHRAGEPLPEAGPAIQVGVSACLLGREVRFDGGHKRCRYISDVLADYFQFVAFCPEVAIGMGTPRQPVRLTGSGQAPRAVGVRDTGLDVTTPLVEYGRSVAGNIEGLSGFILKKDSPSCGMERVRVYHHEDMAERRGTGLFAAEIMRANPTLPVEEEGRLNDSALRENFITRVFVHARWQALQTNGLTRAGLLDFHASHKFLIMAHSTLAYRELGRMLSDFSGVELEALAGRYIRRMMEALKTPATRKRHTNVLQHLVGYLKNRLAGVQLHDLLATIESYRLGDIPLVVPVRMLEHHFVGHPHPYISRQVYLCPHPQALGLRNGI